VKELCGEFENQDIGTITGFSREPIKVLGPMTPISGRYPSVLRSPHPPSCAGIRRIVQGVLPLKDRAFPRGAEMLLTAQLQHDDENAFLTSVLPDVLV
jgi:hypothetical protein